MVAGDMKKWLGIGLGVGLLAGLLVPRRRSLKSRIVVGFPDEWESFAARNPELLKAIPQLFDTIESIFNRPTSLDLPDNVIHSLSRIASEDFIEVFLLSGNGHGIGGLKLLKGMYERVVTTFYLAHNPTEAGRFWNYFLIHKYKMIVHAKRALPNVDELLPQGEEEAIKAARDEVKDDYMDAYEKCGAKRPLPSWVKGGMDTMCKTTKELQQRYWYCYYWPTLHDHATPNNIIERLE
jgi:hypothetical protein